MWTGRLLSCTKGGDKLVSKISSPIQTEPKTFLWTGHRVRPADRIENMVANKPFEGFLANFSAVEKKLRKGMRISYGIQSSSIYLANTGSMAVGICKYLNFAMD